MIGFEFALISALSIAVCGWLVAAVHRGRTIASAKGLEDRLYSKVCVSNEIAHDIKNPLTAILCSAETLEMMSTSSSDRRTLRFIREYGEQILALISDFLDINLAEAGNLRCEPENTSLKTIAEAVAGLLRSTADRKHVAITVSCAAQCADALVDTKHAKQILFNLLHNAIKFTRDSSVVRIQIGSNESKVRLSITDEGEGIEASALASIFSPYSSRNRSLNKVGKGTGIGLALVKSLVELNHGAISVQSEISKGTSFTIELPRGEPITASGTELQGTMSEGDRPLQGTSVLIIDADEGTRHAMAGVVQALGAVVDTAAQVEDALQSLLSHHYGVVMIDAPRGDGSGLALARIIKNDLESPLTRIIMLGDALDEELAREFGVDCCLEKPANSRKLIASMLAL